MANESLSAELERYKEHVKLQEERQNVDLETLMLEEESQSKMLLKQSDPTVLKKKDNIKLVNYALLNQLFKDFGKWFVSQQELSAEQAFWFQMSNPSNESSDLSPVKVDVPSKLPKASLVNTSLKKYKSHLAKFDFVVKTRITPSALIEAELIKKHNIVEKDKYNKLSKSYSKLEQHCISIELAMQLNKEIFQKNNTSMNQSEPTFNQMFKLNKWRVELQEKGTTIKKLKEQIKGVPETSTSGSVKRDIDEIETINIELVHRISKLITENENLKQTYKQLYDSIKPTHVRTKEHSEALIDQLNKKSVEISDLSAQLQEKVFVITALKNDLKKLKGKDAVDNVAHASNATTIPPEMYKLDPQCMFDANHDVCFLNVVNEMNMHAQSKSKSNKKSQSHYIWKPTGKIFTEVGLKWKPIGRTFTLVASVASPDLVVKSPAPVGSIGIPSSTSIDHDAPSSSISQTSLKTPSIVIPLCVEEVDHDIKIAHMDNTPYVDFPIPKLSFKVSSSQVVTTINVHSINQPHEVLGRLTKSHLIENVIGDPSRFVSMRKQLRTDAMWCYFDAFLTFVEPNIFKKEINEPSWIDAMQE
nr:hypothetical protein [Tanacetum cinerariifolium]